MTTSNDWAAKRELLNKVKPATTVFKMCPDPDIRDAYLRARTTVEKAKRRANEARRALEVANDETHALAARRVAETERDLQEAETALTKATKAYDREVIPLTFRSIGREAVEDLKKEHPPTEEEEADGLEWHFDTFAPALISAASVDEMLVEDAARYLSEWTDPDAAALWNAAWGVQVVRRTDVGKG